MRTPSKYIWADRDLTAQSDPRANPTRQIYKPRLARNQLIQHYKGELTENAQLSKAATLAAKKHLLLDSKLPPPIVNAEVKPISRELSKLTKRI